MQCGEWAVESRGVAAGGSTSSAREWNYRTEQQVELLGSRLIDNFTEW